jgi:TPR repeat protein
VDAASRAEIENRAASGNTRAQLELASLLDKAGDLEGTRVWLERAAESGDPLSCTLLGEVLLSRTPYDVPRGVDLICRATAAGNARATHLAALLAAAGVREPQSWPKALELVSKAAQGGWHLAQDTIGVTSSKQPLGYNAIRARSSDPGLWQSLSQAIDLAPIFSCTARADHPDAAAYCDGSRIPTVGYLRMAYRQSQAQLDQRGSL